MKTNRIVNFEARVWDCSSKKMHPKVNAIRLRDSHGLPPIVLVPDGMAERTLAEFVVMKEITGFLDTNGNPVYEYDILQSSDGSTWMVLGCGLLGLQLLEIKSRYLLAGKNITLTHHYYFELKSRMEKLDFSVVGNAFETEDILPSDFLERFLFNK